MGSSREYQVGKFSIRECKRRQSTRSFFGICSAKSSRHQFVIPKCRFKEKIWIFLFDSKVLKSTRGTLFLTSTSRALWRNMQRRFQFHFPHSTEQLGKTKEENPQHHWQKKKKKKKSTDKQWEGMN